MSVWVLKKRFWCKICVFASEVSPVNSWIYLLLSYETYAYTCNVMEFGATHLLPVLTFSMSSSKDFSYLIVPRIFMTKFYFDSFSLQRQIIAEITFVFRFWLAPVTTTSTIEKAHWKTWLRKCDSADVVLIKQARHLRRGGNLLGDEFRDFSSAKNIGNTGHKVDIDKKKEPS
jgi:hypothetical protein